MTSKKKKIFENFFLLSISFMKCDGPFNNEKRRESLFFLFMFENLSCLVSFLIKSEDTITVSLTNHMPHTHYAKEIKFFIKKRYETKQKKSHDVCYTI